MISPPTGRDPVSRNLKWLATYRELGYTFGRAPRLKVFDPSGRLVTTISRNPSKSDYSLARAQLRRHERSRKETR